MDYGEFYEWMVYESIEPFGDRRGDIQAAMMCSLVANVNRGEKTKPYSPMDFVPDWEPKPQPPPDPREQLNKMLMIQQMQNARIGQA